MAIIVRKIGEADITSETLREINRLLPMLNPAAPRLTFSEFNRLYKSDTVLYVAVDEAAPDVFLGMASLLVTRRVIGEGVELLDLVADEGYDGVDIESLLTERLIGSLPG